MNRVIRHAPSDNSLGLGQNNPTTVEGTVRAAAYGLTHAGGIEEIKTSPKVRAIMTGKAIAYGVGRDLPQSVDDRLDIVKFAPGCTPRDVGAKRAYEICIGETPDRMLEAVGRQASYMLDQQETGVVGTSHEVPLSLLMRMIGVKDDVLWDMPELTGYQFTKTPDGMLFVPDRSGDRFLISYNNLEALAEERREVPYEPRKV